MLIEAAWTYRHRRIYGALRARQENIEHDVKVVTAVGRELLGFIWAIGVHVERLQRESQIPNAAIIHPPPIRTEQAAIEGTTRRRIIDRPIR